MEVYYRHYWMDSGTVLPLDPDIDWFVGFGLLQIHTRP